LRDGGGRPVFGTTTAIALDGEGRASLRFDVERLGIGLEPLHRQPIRGRPLPPPLDHPRCQVGRHHPGSGPRRGDGEIAIARRHVEDRQPRTHSSSRHQGLRLRFEHARGEPVVAQRPQHLRAVLERLEGIRHG